MYRNVSLAGTRIIALVAFAVLISGALASCGDSQAASGPSKATFIRRANAICRARSNEIAFYVRVLAKERNEMSPVYYLQSVATDAYSPAFTREIKEIHALRAPEGDSKQIGVILHSTHEAVTRARVYPSPRVNAFARPERLAAEYGLNDCGHP